MSRIVAGEREWRERIRRCQTLIHQVGPPQILRMHIHLRKIHLDPRGVAEKEDGPMFRKDQISRSALSSPAVLGERHESRLTRSKNMVERRTKVIQQVWVFLPDNFRLYLTPQRVNGRVQISRITRRQHIPYGACCRQEAHSRIHLSPRRALLLSYGD